MTSNEKAASPVQAGTLGETASNLHVDDTNSVKKVQLVDAALAALAYARQGWRVFPCNVNKSPKTKNGFKDATSDEQTIQQWWRKTPASSIGIATGLASGLLVLDVDFPDGPDSLAKLEEEYGPLPATLEQRTGSGGRHLFFKKPIGITIKNSAGKIGPNLDIRCEGGYVIVPPSRGWNSKTGCGTGTHYEWVNDLPIAEAPGWLIDMLRGDKKPERKVKERPATPGTVTSSAYGLAALEKEIAILTVTPEGKRNDQLNKSVYVLAQLVAGGELDHESVESELLSVAISIGLPEEEARATIQSGFDAGFKEPRAAPATSNSYHLTELGNAERFRDQHGDVVRYDSTRNKWIYYDGKRWKVGAGDMVRRMAHKTAKDLYVLAAQTTDNDMAQKIAKWAGQSCKSASITAMLKEATALLAIDSAILDAEPWLFNCGNCTINLLTGETHKHRKEDWLTRLSPVDYDPDAKAPIFQKVLNTCFAGKQDLIDFLQRFAGYSLSGSIKEQCIFIWWGSGANGKSTILNALAEASGDYAQTTRPETLMVKKGDGIPSDLAKLKGARLVTAAEAEDGHRLAESQIKQMTGGEKLQARALYQDWFEYIPEFKIVLCTNHRPIIRGDDHAIWRRIRLVPFTVTIPEKDRDKDLPEKLKAELPGILAWMVAGAAEWMKNGLGMPTEVKEATDSYQSEQSVIQIFLDSCCIIKPDEIVESQVLFQAFDSWRTSEGHRKITQTKLGRMLSDLGFEKSRIPGVGRMAYQGLGVNS